MFPNNCFGWQRLPVVVAQFILCYKYIEMDILHILIIETPDTLLYIMITPLISMSMEYLWISQPLIGYND